MLRRALVFFAVLVPCACTLTTDLDGFTGGPTSLPSDDAGLDAVDVGSADVVVVDAGDPYRNVVLSDAPIAYFPLDDAPSASSAADVVGRHAAVVTDGSVVFGVPGVHGTALSFAGQGGLDLGNVFAFAGTAPYTMEAWLKYRTSSGVFHDFFTKRDDTGRGYAFYVRDEQGSLRVQFEHNAPDGARGATYDIVRDTWQHVVVTYEKVDAGQIGVRVYVNGNWSVTGSYDDQKAAYLTTSSLYVGGGFTGTLDEVAFYDHALSSDRVKAHWAAGKP